MAYLDLNVGAPEPMVRSDPGVRAVLPKLGTQERRAVLLARTDPPSSLHRGFGSRLMGLLFGIAPPHMLADARLEALRRYALLYRIHRETMAETEVARARRAGYSDAELAKARALIDATYGKSERKRDTQILAIAFGSAITALIIFAAASQVAPTVDSPLIAAILAGVAIVSLAPMAGRKASSGHTYR